jgi:hypothetical protein
MKKRYAVWLLPLGLLLSAGLCSCHADARTTARDLRLENSPAVPAAREWVSVHAAGSEWCLCRVNSFAS